MRSMLFISLLTDPLPCVHTYIFFFFFNDTATPEIYTLSLHDALPICDFRQNPGLVADGRDMGTTIFPDAQAKIFLTASAEIGRAHV